MNTRKLNGNPWTRSTAMCAALLAVAGCNREQGPGTWVVAIDRSGSTERQEVRTAQLDALGLVEMAALGRRERLDVWAFDRDAVRVFGPSHDTRGLEEAKFAAFGPSGGQRRVTRPGVLLENLASDRSLNRLDAHAPLRVVVLTDGGIDDASDAPRLRRALASLVDRHPRLQVRVVGVVPELRAGWEKAAAGVADFDVAGTAESDRVLRELSADARTGEERGR